MGTQRVTFYVQLVPEWYDGIDGGGRRTVFDVRAARMTVRQPVEPLPGAVVVPVTLDLDPALFGPTNPVSGLVTAGSDGSVHLVPGE